MLLRFNKKRSKLIILTLPFILALVTSIMLFLQNGFFDLLMKSNRNGSSNNNGKQNNYFRDFKEEGFYFNDYSIDGIYPIINTAVATATTSSGSVGGGGGAIGRTNIYYGIWEIRWDNDINNNRLMDIGEVSIRQRRRKEASQQQQKQQWQMLSDEKQFNDIIIRRRFCLYDTSNIGYVYKKTPTRNLKLYIDYPTLSDYYMQQRQTQQQQSDKNSNKQQQSQQQSLRPAIIFFFGGAWQIGKPLDMKPIGTYYAEQYGIIGIRADYRISTIDGISHDGYISALDAITCIRWIKKNSMVLGINPNQIILAGESAGGHLALATQIQSLLLIDNNEKEEEEEDISISTDVSGLILYNPYVIKINEKSWIYKIDFTKLQQTPIWVAYGTGDTGAYVDNPDNERFKWNGQTFVNKLETLSKEKEKDKNFVAFKSLIIPNELHGLCQRHPTIEICINDSNEFIMKYIPNVLLPLSSSSSNNDAKNTNIHPSEAAKNIIPIKELGSTLYNDIINGKIKRCLIKELDYV